MKPTPPPSPAGLARPDAPAGQRARGASRDTLQAPGPGPTLDLPLGSASPAPLAPVRPAAAAAPATRVIPTTRAAAARTVYSVSRLNREVRELLDSGIGQLWVQGELSNFSRPGSGHWYFSLKDRDAQVRCAMFRLRNARTGFVPRDGQQVLVRARVSLYEPRGDYQLLVEELEDAGLGALQRAFEELKRRLAAEGLFAPERKRPLPTAPRCIGVITSPSGAAIRDILHILARRFPAARVLIYAVPVQGAAAAPAIVTALDLASARAECDVLIVARGGGSLEDLWAFNDERVARAIHRARLPIVTGIGHEIDFTIADFVADLRAPTPSGAAELVVPDAGTWRARLEQLHERFVAGMRRTLAAERAALTGLERRLTAAHPGMRLQGMAQRLDELEGRLQFVLQARLTREQTRLQSLSRALQAVSPLATLERGFAVVTRSRDGALVTSAAQVALEELIDVRLASGRLQASVVSHEPSGSDK
ncbi:MAG TPA: exodeoxyribonuclease VII large subunit [Steroidobacteraceae bacterium]|nr:exodeoxyribonuclease VII large subunit [Steroidobacteraceae bacterium]